MRGIKNRAWAAVAAVCVMACMVMPGALQASQGQGPEEKAIPMGRLGAEIDQRYGAQASGPVATGTGYKLAAKMQALEGEVTPAGLTVTSLAKSEGLGSFSIVPVALNGKTLATPSKESICAEADGSVMLERGQVKERFMASSDGIRQDFIISAAPVASALELVLGLAVSNATVSASEKSPGSVMLTLDSGRRLTYSRLHVTDADGKELAARMEVPSTDGREIHIVVDARDARYPVTIDPTITDNDWESMNPGMNGSVSALAFAAADSLYAGGWFTTAGGITVNYIAKWNGESWSALDLGMGGGTYGAVQALAFDATGSLYAGGWFTTAGGVTVNHIAKWNGERWSALDSGVNGVVYALAFDASGNLYAGGSFMSAGGVSANYIAKWNGERWSALDSGVNGVVYALAFDASGNLYAGGSFTTAGGVLGAWGIAKWDGTVWSRVGSGFTGDPEFGPSVYSLAFDASGNLYAGGDIWTVGGKYIAKWNGTSWSAIGSGMNHFVNALVFDASGNLYAGGSFTTAGGVSAKYIAKWDGQSWSDLGSGMGGALYPYVKALAVDSSGNLYAGGLFTTAGGKVSPYIARCIIPECDDDSECREGYQCVDRVCEPIPDNPPVLTAGPFLAAGNWPLLPTSPESPMYLDQNYSVLWKFSDDFGSCSEDCTHVAEYQAVGGSSWTSLPVTVNAAKGTARVTLPIESLQNATTYAFRFEVTDCAWQTTQSATYYFRVARYDDPPAITSGPFLAAGPWPVLPALASNAFVLDQNYRVLWTFSDDYVYCSGLCTHRARYRKVGDTTWTWLPVGTDPDGDWYAYTTLPVESLEAGTYQFWFDVQDCAGQLTKASKLYYFKRE